MVKNGEGLMGNFCVVVNGKMGDVEVFRFFGISIGIVSGTSA